ncbi:MAG: sporulation protein YqfD [Clostridia bacterium]|nr:sporulation protein YqfD [Clostridia bacterium]
MSPTMFLLGSRRLRVDAACRTEVLDLCLQNGFSYSDFRWQEDGSVTFLCPANTARHLLKLCKSRALEVETLDFLGVPSLFWRLRKRAGIWLGAALAIFLFVLSGRFVWDVRVTGNESMTSSEVIAELRECGFGVGSYIPALRTEELATHVTLASDRISWISIYLDGTVAKVQVIEHQTVTDPADTSSAKPANLVAACDGQIEYLELYRGNRVVTVGQAVKKGDLLVSGLYDSQVVGLRYTRAAGQVLARTAHAYRVEIPLDYEQKVYSDAEIRCVTLNFFDFSLKIFENTGNQASICDIIEIETDLESLGLRALPISLTSTRAYPYTLESAHYNEEEALELAYAELERLLVTLSESAELLSKTVRTTWTDTSVILECEVTCIEDIAIQVEFEIQE